jgi:hypothetical protein
MKVQRRGYQNISSKTGSLLFYAAAAAAVVSIDRGRIRQGPEETIGGSTIDRLHERVLSSCADNLIKCLFCLMKFFAPFDAAKSDHIHDLQSLRLSSKLYNNGKP